MILPLTLLAFAAASFPQDSGPKELDEIVVTASGGFEETLAEVPWSTSLIGHEILAGGARSMSEALSGLPSVMVQKTSYGQSSPYIRGFTGYHNVLLVDGIRVNHTAMRAGPNQYWSTIDSMSLDRLELVRGPSSVLYGSDAVGGTVNALTAAPTRSNEGRMVFRLSSAEDSAVTRLESNFGNGTDWGLKVGTSIKGFGDLRGGEDVGVQTATGYDERDWDFRYEKDLANGSVLTLGHQKVFMDDLPRTHKTLDGVEWEGSGIGSELWRRLDQTRTLSYVRNEWEGRGGWMDTGSVTLSMQRHEQERDRMKTSDGVASGGDISGFDLDDWGLTARFQNGMWAYGAEAHRETVDSFKDKTDADGNVTSSSVGSPIADGAKVVTSAAYVQYEWDVVPGFQVIPGLRFTKVSAEADAVNVGGTLTAMPEHHWDTLVGSVRGLWGRGAGTSWYAGLSQGFRTPSLYDLTSTDETSVIEEPQFFLDPEHFVQVEVGTRHRSGNVDWDFGVYQTWITDMVVRSPTEATGSAVGKDNGNGWVHGAEASVVWRPDHAWSHSLTASVMDGEVDQHQVTDATTFDTAAIVSLPMDRLMPLQARIGSRYDTGGILWLEGWAWHMASANALSLRDERDSRIPDTDGDGFADGTPSFSVIGVTAGWDWSEETRFTLSLENMSDTDYRVHGSGVNGAGTNLVGTLEVRF